MHQNPPSPAGAATAAKSPRNPRRTAQLSCSRVRSTTALSYRSPAPLSCQYNRTTLPLRMHPTPTACTAKTICSGELSWRHCRRRVVQWQLSSHLVRPRRGSARQRCASPESLTASVTTIKLDVQRRNTRRPAPPGDRGPQPPANFRPFPSLERGPPEA